MGASFAIITAKMKPLVFPHVYKCGGTAQRRRIAEAVNGRLVAFYPPGHAAGRFTKDAAVLFGHFPASSASLFTETLDWNLATFVREPFARLRSNFDFLKQNQKVHRPAWFTETTTFREFLFHPDTRNILGHFLDVPLDRFLFVGLMEHLEPDTRHLFAMLGWPSPKPLRRENVTRPAARFDGLDLATRKSLVEHHAKDLALFREICDRRGIKRPAPPAGMEDLF